MAEVRSDGNSLFFYTHWTGARLPEDAREALTLASPRRDDLPYALRRIIDHLIHSSRSRDSETGSGIMFRPTAEDEYWGDWNDQQPSVIIDMDKWEVTERKKDSPRGEEVVEIQSRRDSSLEEDY
tara:strand:+ start:656 stop:1030 length:375 start_codon:yes stop_codon:yes gene_type:complete